MASDWQTAFVVSHQMPCCALLTAVKNCNKSLEKLQDFFFKTETKTQEQDQMFKTKTKTKTKTFIFVLEAPRDQDPGLEDYITATKSNHVLQPLLSQCQSHCTIIVTVQI